MSHSTFDPVNNIDLETVVHSFLLAVPEPTDDQVHHFATSLGIPYEDFEEEIFKLFGQELDDVEDPDDVLDLAEELNDDDQQDYPQEEDEPEDPLDMFIVAYFLKVPEPTEGQIHSLAYTVGISPEQLEERIFRLTQELIETD